MGWSWLYVHLLVAQSNTVATGYDISSVHGSAAISMGQIDYRYQSATAGFVSEGVQQPLEWLTTYDAGPIIDDFAIDLFPNPTLNHVIVDTDKEATYHIRIYNSAGQLLQSAVFVDKHRFILHFETFPSGIYLLAISQAANANTLALHRIIRL